MFKGPYTAHDLTRDDIRSLLSPGLHETQGNYTHLVRLFNMDAVFSNVQMRVGDCSTLYRGVIPMAGSVKSILNAVVVFALGCVS